MLVVSLLLLTLKTVGLALLVTAQGPVYLSLGTGDPITTNSTDILITDIGDDELAIGYLPSLTCHTDLVACCRASDHSGTGGLGSWLDPSGVTLSNNFGRGDFFIRRLVAQTILLNRREWAAAISPTGLYCCVVPTSANGEQTFCANLVLCSSLTPPTNGGVSYSDDTRGLGTVATYSCDTGFTLVGDMTRMCTGADTWSGANPTCKSPVYLSLGTGDPITTNNTDILITDIGDDDITPGGLPSLTCHTDLVACCRAGDHSGTGGLGSWLDPNGVILSNNAGGGDFFKRILVAQTILLSRRETVAAISPTGLYCCVIPTAADGEQTFCANLVLCSSLTPPTNGGVSYSDDTRGLGTVATFSCDTGFVLVGDMTRMCTGADTWSGADPTCEVVDCGFLSGPEHGAVDTSAGTVFKSVATYRCNAGYKITGSETRVCQANGQWNSTQPSCTIVDCGHLSDPEHGNVVLSSGTIFNSLARYTCVLGYILMGVTIRICGSNGMWIPEAPRCTVVDCGPLPNPDHGQVVTLPGTTYNSRATYTCIDGYILNGTALRTCHHNGSWIPMAPVCDPISCGLLPDPENGVVVISSHTYLGRATYTCNTGYRLRGVMTRTCNSSGHWDPTAPSCYPVDCGSLSNPVNGTVDTSTGTTYKKVATYSCDLGHTLNGSMTRRCSANGQWIPSAPNCPIVDCGSLSDPKKGLVDTSSGMTYNSIADYSCIEGYVLVGEAERRCGSNGMWTPASPPTCAPIDCGPLDNPKNGVVHTEPDTHLSSTATYSCNPGYNLTGNTQRVCQSDGSWSFSAPYCADLAVLQLKFGPTSYCVEWSEPRVELMYTTMRGSVFKAILEKGGYTIPQDKINKGFFTCSNSKTQTTYRTTIAGLRTVSAVDLAGMVQQWVESGATMRVLWYLIKIDESCPVLISSMDEDECE